MAATGKMATVRCGSSDAMSVVHKSAQWRQPEVGLEDVAAFMGCILTVIDQ